jgi:hypothetical protein
MYDVGDVCKLIGNDVIVSSSLGSRYGVGGGEEKTSKYVRPVGTDCNAL